MPLEPTSGTPAEGYCLQVFPAHHTHQFTHEFSGRARTAQFLRREHVIDIQRVVILADIGVNQQVAERQFIAFLGLVKRYMIVCRHGVATPIEHSCIPFARRNRFVLPLTVGMGQDSTGISPLSHHSTAEGAALPKQGDFSYYSVALSDPSCEPPVVMPTIRVIPA